VVGRIARARNDHIVGSNKGDCIDGGPGDDELWGANQSDVVIGGSGEDVLNRLDGVDKNSNGSDLLYGGEGDDVIYGGNAKDKIFGDSLFGEDGDDMLFGGRGSDVVVDGGPEITGDECVDASGDGGYSTERFQDCESIVHGLDDADLANLIATTP
jgi:Ca2+-binding RTX toxin-like protein